MKKLTKMMALMSSLCFAATAFSALPVGAAEVKGDVDGDGYLTGHDAAVVSRYIHEGDVALTDEQLQIADVDGNGKVEQADADWMFENQVYSLGDSGLTEGGTSLDEAINITTAYNAMVLESFIMTNTEPWWLIWNSGTKDLISRHDIEGLLNLTNVHYTEDDFAKCTEEEIMLLTNLLDFDGDGIVELSDAYSIMMVSSWRLIGAPRWNEVYVDGKYYVDESDPRF